MKVKVDIRVLEGLIDAADQRREELFALILSGRPNLDDKLAALETLIVDAKLAHARAIGLSGE